LTERGRAVLAQHGVAFAEVEEANRLAIAELATVHGTAKPEYLTPWAIGCDASSAASVRCC